MSRSLYTSQVKLRRIHVKVDGESAAPVADGVDKYLVDSVVDNGTGDYTINLTGKAKARNANDLDVISIVPIGVIAIPQVYAVTDESVSVKFFDEDGVAVDADFGIEIQANDNRFLTGYQ